MRAVLRRTLLLSVLVLVASTAVGGCAGADRTVATVGDESISREELLNYSSVFQRIELSSTHPAPSLRAAAQAWIQDSAGVQALAGAGIELDDERRLEAEQLLQQAIQNDEILPVAPSTPGYDFMVRRAWLLREDRIADPAVQEAALDLLTDDVDVSSRLGRWDPVTLQITPLG